MCVKCGVHEVCGVILSTWYVRGAWVRGVTCTGDIGLQERTHNNSIIR